MMQTDVLLTQPLGSSNTFKMQGGAVLGACRIKAIYGTSAALAGTLVLYDGSNDTGSLLAQSARQQLEMQEHITCCCRVKAFWFGQVFTPSLPMLTQRCLCMAKAPAPKKKGPSLAVGRGEKLPVSKGAGLTAKGRAKYNKETGSNLKAPQPQGGARKDSFCARMSGMPGPMKDEKGQPTRKAASLARWKC